MTSPSTSPLIISTDIVHWLRLGLGGLWCAFAGFTIGNAAAEWTITRRNREKRLSDNEKHYYHKNNRQSQTTTSTSSTADATSVSLSIGIDIGVNTDGAWGRYVIEASDLLVAVVACDGRAVGFGTLDTMEDPSLSMTSVVRCKFRPSDTTGREGAGSGELSFQIFFDPTENYLRYVSKFDLSSADLPDEVIAYTAASWNSTMRYCRLTQCGGPGGGGTGPSDGMNLDMVSTVPQYFATQTHAIEWLARLTKVFMSSISRCLLHIRDCRNGSMPFATKDMLEANTVLSTVPNSSINHQAIQRQRQRSVSSSSSCEEKFCPICLEAFAAGELVRRLPCMHVFHKTKTCDIDKHLKRNKQCPTCKTPIDISYDYLLTIPHDTATIPPQEQNEGNEWVEGDEPAAGAGIVPTNEVSEQVADLERMLGGLRESLNNYERMRRAIHAFYQPSSIDNPEVTSNQIEDHVPLDHQTVRMVNNESHGVVEEEEQEPNTSIHSTTTTIDELSLAPSPSPSTETPAALLPTSPPLLLLPPTSSSHDATNSNHTTDHQHHHPDDESCNSLERTQEGFSSPTT